MQLYNLTVTINYSVGDDEKEHVNRTEAELMSMIRMYLSRPNATSFVFTVAKSALKDTHGQRYWNR